MTTIVDDRSFADHDAKIAGMILLALGVSEKKAKVMASMPILQPLNEETEPAKPRRVRGVKAIGGR